MAGTKYCRVCGKAYSACHTPNPNGVFRWRDVACSLGCAAIYLDRLDAAKAAANEESDKESE